MVTGVEARSISAVNAAARAEMKDKKEELLKLSGELARSLAENGEQPDIEDALNAVLGYEHLGWDRSRYGETEARRERFSELFKKVAANPLGRIALFDEKGYLDVVGVTTDQPLALDIRCSEHPSTLSVGLLAKVNLSRGSQNTSLASAGWDHFRGKYMLSPALVNISREGVHTGRPYDPKRVELLGGVAAGFDLIRPEDKNGRAMLGRFFDQELRATSI